MRFPILPRHRRPTYFLLNEMAGQPPRGAARVKKFLSFKRKLFT
jgi:hypothetical protein